MLGYHARPGDKSVVVYYRDAMAEPLRHLALVLRLVQLKEFDPDRTRSGYWPKAPDEENAVGRFIRVMEGMTREEPDREPRPWATPGSGDQGPAPAPTGPGLRDAPTERRAAAPSQPAAPHVPKRPHNFASSSRLPKSSRFTSPLLSIAQPPPPARAAVSTHAPSLAAAPPPPDDLERGPPADAPPRGA